MDIYAFDEHMGLSYTASYSYANSAATNFIHARFLALFHDRRRNRYPRGRRRKSDCNASDCVR